METNTLGAFEMIKPILSDKKLLSEISKWVKHPCESVEVIHDLKDTAATLNNCAGLAAPQIGHMLRIIYVDVQGKALIMVNPEIIETKGKNIFGNESCFSVPVSMKYPKRVKRKFKIKVKYNAESGEIVTKTFKSFEARLIQHEIDHLDGILI